MHLIFSLIKVETSEEAVEEDEPASEDEVDEDDAERSWKRWPACWPVIQQLTQLTQTSWPPFVFTNYFVVVLFVCNMKKKKVKR